MTSTPERPLRRPTPPAYGLAGRHRAPEAEPLPLGLAEHVDALPVTLEQLGLLVEACCMAVATSAGMVLGAALLG